MRRSAQSRWDSWQGRPEGRRGEVPGRQPWQFPDQAAACRADSSSVPTWRQQRLLCPHGVRRRDPPGIAPQRGVRRVICVTNNPNFNALLSGGGLEGPIAPAIVRMIADDCDCGDAEVRRIAAREITREGRARASPVCALQRPAEFRSADSQSLREGEWQAFAHPGSRAAGSEDTFVTRDAGAARRGLRRAGPMPKLGCVPNWLRRIDKVVLALRLRRSARAEGVSRGIGTRRRGC